jgi:nucleotide-binding universal stress UspA family protein
MAFKTISTVITDPRHERGLIRAALDLAGDLSAHLDIYGLAVDPTRYDPLPAGTATVLLEASGAETRERAREIADWVEGQLPAGMIKVAVEPVVLPQMGLDSGLGRMLRYSDLMVCRRPYGKSGSPLLVQVLEAALFQRGVPVLVVPPQMDSLPAPRKVMIAWDDSDGALAAIRQAMPFLAAAEIVNVVMVDPPRTAPDRSDPGGGIAQKLARHGVHTEVTIMSRTQSRIADCLLRHAREQGLQMVVMGAYGHSRMREALLGGPTRDMLQDAEIPILMAH